MNGKFNISDYKIISDFNARWCIDILAQQCGDNHRLFDLLCIHSANVAAKTAECLQTYAKINGCSPDIKFAVQGALLHDIGIIGCNAPSIFCYGQAPYLQHGIIGAEILRSLKLDNYSLICERHTGAGISALEIVNSSLPLPPRDFLPLSLEEKAVCYADKFYSKSSQPSEPKQLKTIIAQMQRFGADSLARFEDMHEMFKNR